MGAHLLEGAFITNNTTRGSHKTQYCHGYGKLEYLCGYSAADASTLPFVTLAAGYPQSTINGTPTCSSHSGTAFYETYFASGRNLDVYVVGYRNTK